MIKKQYLQSIRRLGLVFSTFLTIFISIPVQAIDGYFENIFSQNDITFYDPDECTTDCRVSCVGSDGSDVTVIGDSILADEVTKQKLKEKLSGLSLDGNSYDSVASRSWDEGIKVAESMQLKNIVVFELGTNNTDGITATQLNNLLNVVGTNRTLILVTPYKYNDATVQTKYDEIAELFRQTATSNSQIKIADWASAAKNANLPLDTEQGVSWSGVHPKTSEERDLYVGTLTAAIGGSCNSGEAIVSGATAEEKVWSGFISLGYTPAQTAGIMGNIAHEGVMNPAQWQQGHEKNWGKTLRQIYELGDSNDTGMGLVGFTFYKYFDILDKYYREHAPDLLKILEDPYTYSVAENGSHICDGTSCFLKKVDDDTANRLYSTQITIINNTVRGKYKESHGISGYSGFFDCNTPEGCAEWWLTNYERPADPEASRALRVNDAKKFYDEFKDKTTFSGTSGSGGTAGSNCRGAKAASAFHKYNFTDGQLRGILAMAKKENGGSLSAIKTEISLMANLAEKNGSTTESGLIDYIKKGGWFTGTTGEAYDENYSASQEELDAAKDILNSGNRTLPSQIVEHDCFYGGDCTSGINKASNNGVEFSYTDTSQYQRGITKLENTAGATYIFWDWADPENKSGDPFGYFENDPPDPNFNAEATKKATSAVSAVNVTWSNGWITSGIDGYIKSTPESINLKVGDSSPNQSYITNRPVDNSVGPNKILLHNTEGGYDGNNAIDIYTGNPYPPHFTVDMKNKKVYQHFTIDNPSSAVSDVDTSAGVQIEIVGFSLDFNDYKKGYVSKEGWSKWYLFNSNSFGDEEWKYLAKLLVAISDYTGIPLTSSVDWNNRTDSSRLSVDAFKDYQGVLGHQHAPLNDHNDPGDVWSLVSKHFNTLSANLNTTCSIQEPVRDFIWYDQCDKQWSSTMYGTSSCATTTCEGGCGVVSFTMLVQILTGVKLDPAEVTLNAGRKGLYACGQGSYHSLPETLASDYGVEVEILSRDPKPSIDELNAKLRAGGMIWTCGDGANPFTDVGHCIGIRGVTSSGKWLLADSAGERGRKNSMETEWDPSAVYVNMGPVRLIKKR